MALGFRYGRYRTTRHFSALPGFRDFFLQENEYCPDALMLEAGRPLRYAPIALLLLGHRSETT